jgi:hypothetical protein
VQLAAWTAAAERMKMGAKCGALYVVTKATKAGLAEQLAAVTRTQVDALVAFAGGACASVTAEARAAAVGLTARPSDVFEYAGVVFSCATVVC